LLVVDIICLAALHYLCYSIFPLESNTVAHSLVLNHVQNELGFFFDNFTCKLLPCAVTMILSYCNADCTATVPCMQNVC